MNHLKIKMSTKNHIPQETSGKLGINVDVIFEEMVRLVRRNAYDIVELWKKLEKGEDINNQPKSRCSIQ
jgi:hypothetical protein